MTSQRRRNSPDVGVLSRATGLLRIKPWKVGNQRGKYKVGSVWQEFHEHNPSNQHLQNLKGLGSECLPDLLFLLLVPWLSWNFGHLDFNFLNLGPLILAAHRMLAKPIYKASPGTRSAMRSVFSEKAGRFHNKSWAQGRFVNRVRRHHFRPCLGWGGAAVELCFSPDWQCVGPGKPLWCMILQSGAHDKRVLAVKFGRCAVRHTHRDTGIQNEIHGTKIVHIWVLRRGRSCRLLQIQTDICNCLWTMMSKQARASRDKTTSRLEAHGGTSRKLVDLWREFCARGVGLLRGCLGARISTQRPSEANFLEVYFERPWTDEKSVPKRFHPEKDPDTVLLHQAWHYQKLREAMVCKTESPFQTRSAKHAPQCKS